MAHVVDVIIANQTHSAGNLANVGMFRIDTAVDDRDLQLHTSSVCGAGL
jgi:hypothetical protein